MKFFPKNKDGTEQSAARRPGRQGRFCTPICGLEPAETWAGASSRGRWGCRVGHSAVPATGEKRLPRDP